MAIESNHSTVQGRTATAHASGKASGLPAAGAGDKFSDFSDLMGGLLATSDVDLGQTTAAAAPTQLPDQGATSVAVLDASLAGAGATGPFNLAAQAPGLVFAPASAASAVPAKSASSATLARIGATPVDDTTGSAKVSKSSATSATGATDGVAGLIETSASAKPMVGDVPAKESLVRARALKFEAAQDDSQQLAPAPTLAVRVQARVETLPVGALAGPDSALWSNGKERPRALFAEENWGLTGPALVADRLGISTTYQVTQASAVVPDTQVAETVSYWVAQGIQSAEFTVEGLGKESVEVHIALNGDQAQVDFRSDQQQVRQVIEAATPQLKDLLLTQGIELSGVSVGSFAQGTHQSGARTHKPGVMRMADRQGVQDAQVASMPGRGSSAGRALDLYV